MTNRTWISPPAVYEVAIPRAHKINKTTQIVQSIVFLLREQWLHARVQSRRVELHEAAGQSAHGHKVQNMH
jgi:hypothetical protein